MCPSTTRRSSRERDRAVILFVCFCSSSFQREREKERERVGGGRASRKRKKSLSTDKLRCLHPSLASLSLSLLPPFDRVFQPPIASVPSSLCLCEEQSTRLRARLSGESASKFECLFFRRHRWSRLLLQLHRHLPFLAGGTSTPRARVRCTGVPSRPW